MLFYFLEKFPKLLRLSLKYDCTFERWQYERKDSNTEEPFSVQAVQALLSCQGPKGTVSQVICTTCLLFLWRFFIRTKILNAAEQKPDL